MSGPRSQEVRIRRCGNGDTGEILAVINDAANAYRGVIPDDCMHEPYMSAEELEREIADGVEFWGAELDGRLTGVMGIQYLADVTLIRHAYVRSEDRGHGIGGRLLSHLMGLTDGPVLVGTWRAAAWAVRFYEKHGFSLLGDDEHAAILNSYWKISPRQVETSVVLADTKWRTTAGKRE